MLVFRKILTKYYMNDPLEKLPLRNLLISALTTMVCKTKAMIFMNGREIFSVSNNLPIELWRIPMTKRNIHITNKPPQNT